MTTAYAITWEHPDGAKRYLARGSDASRLKWTKLPLRATQFLSEDEARRSECWLPRLCALTVEALEN